MKKHQLIKHAYDNYPKGTKYKNLGCDGAISESSGNFHIDKDGIRDTETHCFVFGTENKWAEIISASEPLKLEKIAVKVNNERDFKLLMKHYDELGWKWNGGHSALEFSTFKYPCSIWYEDSFVFDGLKTSDGRQLIDFDFFCDQKGITIPKPILTSVDGVELFEGDDYYRACNIAEKGVWTLITIGGSNPTSGKISRNRLPASNERFFSTKEAAEKWIDTENKPREIVFESESLIMKISAEGFTAEAKSDTRRFAFTKEDISKIVSDMKSLQKP